MIAGHWRADWLVMPHRFLFLRRQSFYSWREKHWVTGGYREREWLLDEFRLALWRLCVEYNSAARPCPPGHWRPDWTSLHELERVRR